MQRRLWLTALFVLGLSVAPAHAKKPVTREVALEMAAEPGRWAAIKGKLQNDGTFFAKEIELIALGDEEGTEVMEIRGVITSLDVPERSLRAMNYAVVWAEDARIRDADKKKIKAAGMKTGIGATIEGHFDDGTFRAIDVRLRGGKIKDGELIYKQEIVGPFQVIDLERGLMRVIDTDVRLNPDCKFFELPMQVKSVNP